jgi:hypothetical protein
MDTVFTAGKYLDWGVVSISVANLLIIVVMVVVFVLALLLPFPHGQAARVEQPASEEEQPS